MPRGIPILVPPSNVMVYNINGDIGKRSNHFKNISGQLFTRLLVLDEFYVHENRNIFWKCKCINDDNIRWVKSVDLKSKHIQSCGCLWKEKNREACYRGNDYMSGWVISQIIKGAKDRDLPCPSNDILNEWVQELGDKQNCLCNICKIKMSPRITWKAHNAGKTGISLDRIDNSNPAGYTLKSNLQLLCAWCNKMKETHTQEEFVQHCIRVANHNTPEFIDISV